VADVLGPEWKRSALERAVLVNATLPIFEHDAVPVVLLKIPQADAIVHLLGVLSNEVLSFQL
jgi:hypothetical protein